MSGPTRRQIEAELEELKRGGALPEAGLLDIFAAETIEWIDREEHIARLDGELCHVPNAIYEGLFK